VAPGDVPSPGASHARPPAVRGAGGPAGRGLLPDRQAGHQQHQLQAVSQPCAPAGTWGGPGDPISAAGCVAPWGGGCHGGGSAAVPPGRDSCQKGWRLLSILAAYFKCSEMLQPFLLAFLRDAGTHPELPFQGRGTRTPRGAGCSAGKDARMGVTGLRPSQRRGSARSPVPARHRQSLRAEPAENPGVRRPQPLPRWHGAQGHGGEDRGWWGAGTG